MTFAAAIIVAALSVAAPVAATRNHPLPRDWYVRLARCETGNNLRHGYPLSQFSNYTSAFGIYLQTWRTYADKPSARGMGFEAQARIVDRIAWHGHHNGQRRIAPVGPWGWGAVSKNCLGLQGDICTSNRPEVRRWQWRCFNPTAVTVSQHPGLTHE